MDAAYVKCSLAVVLILAMSSVIDGARISGQVISVDSGKPLSAANVMVSNPAENTTVGKVSDTDGHFLFDGLAPGAYRVSATHIGYHSSPPREVTISAARPAILLLQIVTRRYELEETVVSGTHLAESVRQTPVSIARIDGTQIRRNAGGHSYINDLRHVRGIDYQQLGLFQERFAARGLNAAFNKRMLLVTDGRVTESSGGSPYYNPTTTKDDVRDMEVITGPGSALYGPDAVSGIISLRTRDPRADQSTTVAISGGARELFKGRAHHAELLNEKWGWKASGDYQRGRDFDLANTYFTPDSTSSVTEDPDFDTEIIVGGIGVYYYPDDSSMLRATAGATRVNGISQSTLTGRVQVVDSYYHYQQLAYETTSLYVSAYNTGADVGDSFLLDIEAGLRLSGRPPQQARQGAAITSESALRQVEGRYRFDVSAWPRSRFIVGGAWRQQYQQSSFIQPEQADRHMQEWEAEQERRRQEEGEHFDEEAYEFEKGQMELWRDGEVTVNQLGVYGHAETELTPGLKGLLASRLDWHEDYGSQLSPRLAFVYSPHDRLSLRASLNRAFKSPTVLDQHVLIRGQPPAVIRGNHDGFRFGSLSGDPLPCRYENGVPAIEPEENMTVELGLKGALADRLFVDINGYRSWYENFGSPFTTPIGDLESGIVTLDEDGVPRSGEVTLTTINFGKLAVIGLDFGANAYLTQKITLRANASFIDAGDLKEANGMELPFNTPGTIVKLGLSADDHIYGRTSLDLFARYVAEHDFREAQFGGTVPAYTVFDLGLGYRASGIDYRISVQNLFDNRHREFLTAPRIGRLSVFEIQYTL